MYRAVVTTPWAGDGSMGNPYRPLLAGAYAVQVADLTGQPSGELPPMPNAYTVLVEGPDLAVIDAIRADDRFVTWLVTEIDPDGLERAVLPARPTVAERGEMIARLRAMGYTPAAAAALVRANTGRPVLAHDAVAAMRIARRG